MTVEHACVRVVGKPWGSTDLRPWSDSHGDGAAIGELWFQRADPQALEPALLLKLLFTSQPLSIQVHPDDAFARSIGLAHGKTEAWYILAAAPDAKVAVGLKRHLTAPQLRAAIEDGSIAELVQWRPAVADEVVFVPAGTIHSIGAGLVLAEIQQRGDTTLRLFDHGRQRRLHVEHAATAAHAGPAEDQPAPSRMTDARTLLIACPHFVLERIDLLPTSNWALHAAQETWVLVLAGSGTIGPVNARVGDGVFLDTDHAGIAAGADGLKGLVAYVGAAPSANLLRNLDGRDADFPPPLHQAVLPIRAAVVPA